MARFEVRHSLHGTPFLYDNKSKNCFMDAGSRADIWPYEKPKEAAYETLKEMAEMLNKVEGSK